MLLYACERRVFESPGMFWRKSGASGSADVTGLTAAVSSAGAELNSLRQRQFA